MNIYFLLGIPVIGELSPETKKERHIACEICGRSSKTVFSDIEYIFDQWNGQDIFSGLAEYFISERLKTLLEHNNCNGYELQPVKASFSRKTTKANYFGKNAYQNELPNFYHLKVTASAEGDIDSWYEVFSVNEKCGHKKELLTLEGMRSMSNPELIGEDKENPLPRNVYKDSWKGDAMFLLQDGLDIPIVTQTFVDCLSVLNININKREGVWVRPVSWIELGAK